MFVEAKTITFETVCTIPCFIYHKITASILQVATTTVMCRCFEFITNCCVACNLLGVWLLRKNLRYFLCSRLSHHLVLLYSSIAFVPIPMCVHVHLFNYICIDYSLSLPWLCIFVLLSVSTYLPSCSFLSHNYVYIHRHIIYCNTVLPYEKLFYKIWDWMVTIVSTNTAYSCHNNIRGTHTTISCHTNV